MRGWDQLRGATAGQAGRAPLPQRGPGSLLVVIGGVREGKLEAIGLGQEQADVLVTPAGCGQVLEEEEQLLGRETAVSRRTGWQAV